MLNQSISIIIPALNEEKNLENVILEFLEYFKKNDIDWEIILINDGSIDDTENIMNKYAEKYSEKIKKITHIKNEGLGKSFIDGLELVTKTAVTWFPSDGENKPDDLLKYIFLINYVDVIVPFAVNRGVRSIFRRILSTIYLSIINISFGMSFNYTNGNIIYKTELLRKLKINSKSFFFQVELLIKSVRKSNFLFSEVPIKLEERTSGKSKAFSLRNIIGVIKDFIFFFIYIHFITRFYEPNDT